MTYIANIDPNSNVVADIYAAQDVADRTMPGWFEAEQAGTRFLTERDFPIYDDEADRSRVSNEDWELFGASRF